MYFQVYGIKICVRLWSTEVSDYTGCVFYAKVLVNDILVGLERFNCIYCAFPLWYLEHSRDNTSYRFTVI